VSRIRIRTSNSAGHIPLWLKIFYTSFVAVLVPYYWITYSPWNFLFFCDVALFFGLMALWTENPLLASLPAVGLAIPQLLWCLDFLSGSRIVGMTAYMFDARYPLLVRGLSLFHGWLPFLLIWMVWRLGYDRRALLGWTIISCVILLASYMLAPAPPAPPESPNQAVNLNYVHGLTSERPQSVMPPLLWLGIMLAGFPLVFYLPAHLAFSAWFPHADGHRPALAR
jgi:hypothetical protein